jgi:alkylation response protein AidB-like acyl-CoA dehydrogenase
MQYGSPSQKEDFLPRIAEGNQVWTLALTEPSATHDLSGIELRAEQKDDGFLLSGTKIFVPYAHVADELLVVARTGPTDEQAITFFIVEGNHSGLTKSVIPTTARDKQCEVHFDEVKVPVKNILGEAGEGRNVAEFIFQKGAVLKSAEMLGGCQKVLDMTTGYAKERVQFDRAIGSFQAIQHKLADLLIDVEGLRYMVYEVSWAVANETASQMLISMVKAKANEVYQRICIECMKVHGAVGFTRELDMGLYHLRTRASQFLMGDSDFHREAIAMGLEHYDAPAYSLTSG